MPKRSLPRTKKIFDQLFDVLEEQFPDYGTLELHLDEEAGSDNGHGAERQFGWCTTTAPFQISFASKIETIPDAYIDGLLRHEFGHAIDHRYGTREVERRLHKRLPKSVERRADKIAEYVFGSPIQYGRLDIQCVNCRGKKSRPKKLG